MQGLQVTLKNVAWKISIKQITIIRLIQSHVISTLSENKLFINFHGLNFHDRYKKEKSKTLAYVSISLLLKVHLVFLLSQSL